jgi:hypothetical protein
MIEGYAGAKIVGVDERHRQAPLRRVVCGRRSVSGFLRGGDASLRVVYFADSGHHF